MGEDFIFVGAFSSVIDAIDPQVQLRLYPWYKNPPKDKAEQQVSIKIERE